jgi:hypothetical protein
MFSSSTRLMHHAAPKPLLLWPIVSALMVPSGGVDSEKTSLVPVSKAPLVAGSCKAKQMCAVEITGALIVDKLSGHV